MPRAFNDYEIVIVQYRTRSDDITFLGEVMGYSDKKYTVRTLASLDGYYRVSCDFFIQCHVYELQRASQADIDNMTNKQRAVLSSILKDWKYYVNGYRNDSMKNGLAYTSFALKRLTDGDYKRRYVYTKPRERNRYVY